jgi:hypothetical protein
MASTPKKKEPASAKRGEIYVLVTDWPARARHPPVALHRVLSRFFPCGSMGSVGWLALPDNLSLLLPAIGIAILPEFRPAIGKTKPFDLFSRWAQPALTSSREAARAWR